MEEEYGDLLFTLVNLGRLPGVHPDTALRRANRSVERLEGWLSSVRPALLWDEVKELERA